MGTATTEGMNISQLAYGEAIDLLELADTEHEIGGLIVFPAQAADGRPSIVIINQLDTEGCVQIRL